MSLKLLSITGMFAAGVAGGAIAFAPAALADDSSGCQTSATTTSCQSPGSASVSVAPGPASSPGGASGNGVQNGEYGPSGNTPPVGH